MDHPAADPASINPSLALTAEERPALTPAQFTRLSWLSARLPARWLATRRRRRFLFLALAAPGFLAVFATPLHRQLFLMVLGFPLFGAAILLRALTEPLFVRADAAELWPLPSSSTPVPKVSRHA